MNLPALCVLLFAIQPAQANEPPRPDTPTPNTRVRTVTEAERPAALEELRQAARRFRETSRAYDTEMRLLVVREIRQRTAYLERSYERRINEVDLLQSARRMEAIEALQNFLARYPRHPEHTPDAMFRLAELYDERAQVNHQASMTEYERIQDLYDRGKVPEEPGIPNVDYSDATQLYETILQRFPNYRYRDVALYMKGYAQYRSGLEREARDTWLSLARNFPNSSFVAEAWMRVGEYHFDFGEWRLAQRAYAKSAEHPESRYYTLVLYKLAWSYFQQFDYDKAIRGFKRLIAHYSEIQEQTARGAELRVEAVQYLARSLAEDDWDGDGLADEDAGIERALAYLSEGLDFENDILLEYAKALYELHEPEKYRQSAEVYRTLIERDPLNPANPELHEHLIETYDLAGDLAGAARERNNLIERYQRNSEWYQANLENVRATMHADRLVEVALRQRAKSHHQLAQNLKIEAAAENDPLKLAQAQAEYQRAADAYRQYIATYPNRRETLEMKFLLAEALYWSAAYTEAATAYAVVRDHPGRNEYREHAGYAAIQSSEQHLESLKDAGDLPEKALAVDADTPPEPEEARGTEVVRATPEEIPAVVMDWVGHTDRFIELELSNEDNPEFPIEQSYRIALVFYNYRDYEEARKRFQAIMERWPRSTEASFAALSIINSYKDENDWVNIERWTQTAIDGGYGDPEQQAALRNQIRMFRLGQQFERAEALYQEKQYIEAAEEFERIVDSDPNTPVGDKALYNAAMAYQDAKHWNSAARVFERIIVEPRFNGSQYREDALFFSAENNFKFFAFQNAIQRYTGLRASYPESRRAFYALYRSAEINEMLGNYEEAARLYEQFSNDYPERDNAPRALYRAGMVYDRLGNVSEQTRIWRLFIERFQERPGTDARIVECHVRMARTYKARNNWRQAKRAYESTIAEFESRGLEPQTAAASYAAEAKFEIIEETFRRYERMALRGSLANQGRTLQAKRALIPQLQDAYMSVFVYKAFDWTVAAYFRIGQLYQLFAKTLYEAPDPPGLGWEDMEEYRTMVEDEGLKWENVAIERYEVTVAAARDMAIVNDWSQRALESLNRYKPQEYPLFKSDRRAYDFGTGALIPLSPDAAAEPEAPIAPASGSAQPDEPRTPSAPANPQEVEVPTDPSAPPNTAPGDVPTVEEVETPEVSPPQENPTQESPTPEPDSPGEVPVPDEVPIPDGGLL